MILQKINFCKKNMFLDFVRLEGKEAVLPKRQTPGSAGYDLYSSQNDFVYLSCLFLG